MNSQDAVANEAARIIATESMIASLEQALITTVGPIVSDTLKTVTAGLDDLDERITRLERIARP